MVYQIALETSRKKFTISDSRLRDLVGFIYAALWICSFIEACIVIFCLGLLILSIASGLFIDKSAELLLWVMCVFVWTLIPCLVYGIIEQDLMIPDNCIYKDVRKIKRRGGYHYVR